jgi:hypothetical protein
VAIQLAGELLVEFGFTSAREPFRERSRAHPVLAGAGVLLLGAIAGAITCFIRPTRVFQPGAIPGLSLLVSPILTGLIMDRYGEWRESRGSTRSYLATFWGGALFAFGMALVRFTWLSMSRVEA